MSKQTAIRYALALTICLGLGAIMSLASILPCGYHDAATGDYAGHGYHSLAEVVSEGFEWDSQTVPNPYEKYTGTGPYIATCEFWIAALFIPIFFAIIFLGWLIIGGNGRNFQFIPLSRK